MTARIAFLTLISISLAGCESFKPLSPLHRLERSVVFQPAPFPKELEARKLPFEDAHFESADGTQLHGWFVDHPNPSAIALFCHGNAGNISSRGDTLLMLRERHNIAVLTFDYRGYGKSGGKPDEQGILEDARAARRWLAQRKGIPESEILLMGRSLGGAVAVDLASKDGARGLVLASTFNSLPDVASRKFPWLPCRLAMSQRFDSESKIKNYQGPLLQSHGDHDRLIPIDLAKKLHRAHPGPKQFVVIEGGGHRSPQNETYRQAFDQFLSQLIKPGRRNFVVLPANER